MKTWNYPDIPCNAQGNGKGICNNCRYNVVGGNSIGSGSNTGDEDGLS